MTRSTAQLQADLLTSSGQGHGITIRKVELRDLPIPDGSGRYRGLVATETILPGDVLIEVSKSQLLTLKTVAREAGFDWRQYVTPIPPDHRLNLERRAATCS